MTGAHPPLDAVIEVGDVGVAELAEDLGRERGSSTAGAVHDRPPTRVELVTVMRVGRIGPELEHAARCVHRARDHPGRVELTGLSYVDEKGAAAGGGLDFVHRQAADL